MQTVLNDVSGWTRWSMGTPMGSLMRLVQWELASSSRMLVEIVARLFQIFLERVYIRYATICTIYGLHIFKRQYQ